MQVNLFNYATPKGSSISLISRPVAFGSAQEKKYTPFPNLGAVPADRPLTIMDEIRESGLYTLSDVVAYERESDHWRVHYDMYKAFLPEEVIEEFKKVPELGLGFEGTYPNLATYWRIKTKEGLKLFVDTITVFCGKDVIKRNFAQLTERMANYKKGFR